jgi:hypothetical protein
MMSVGAAADSDDFRYRSAQAVVGQSGDSDLALGDAFFGHAPHCGNGIILGGSISPSLTGSVSSLRGLPEQHGYDSMRGPCQR